MTEALVGLLARARLRLQRFAHLVCVGVMAFMAWQVWLKADKIAAYADATDVLRIAYGPFVYFMAVMIALTGLIHLYKLFEPPPR